MPQGACRVAFKEWAVTVDALARGEQIVLLRKGGIHEEGRHFKIEHWEFLFFPGYLHQNADLLKPDYRSRLPAPGAEIDETSVTMSLFAEVADAVQITGEETAARLEPYHIWAPNYAQKRIHWKPRFPLNVLLLRCHVMANPVTVPVLPEYGGCKSWVTLAEECPLGEMRPVMSDEEFSRRVAEIRDALSEATAAR